VDEAAPVGQGQLADGERGGQDGCRRMPHHGKVGVVVVERVGGGAVGERGPRSTGASAGADHGGQRRAAFHLRDPLDDAGRGLHGAGQHDAEAVEDGAPGRLHRFRGAVLPPALDEKLGDAGGGAGPDEGGGVGHGAYEGSLRGRRGQ
jgi:hypothetical protein